MFSRLGTWSHDHRKLVLGLWVVALVAANIIAGGIGDAYRQDFSLNGFESTEGFKLVESQFSDGSGSPQSGQIVFSADQGVSDPEVKAAMEEMFEKVGAIEDVTSVQSPYASGGEFQISNRGPLAGKIAYATVNLPEDIDFTRASEIGKEIRKLTPEVEGLRIELGGFLFAEFEQPSAELFGLAFAIIILIIAFGSVIAMGLPVAVGLFGIGMGGALVILASHFLEVPDFAPFIGVMIGLGVGIDYALLIVTRHREQLHSGYDVRQSVAISMDTAGRSVLFAGLTVVVSLLGMLLMGIGFIGGLGITASLTVLATVIASLTLLPALLGFAGTKIEQTKWRGLLASGFVALALAGAGLKVPAVVGLGFLLALLTIVLGFFVPALKREVPRRPAKPRQQTVAYRWSRVIQHRPWTATIAAGGLLLVLAIPVFQLRLGFSDESNFADDTTTKQAYDLVVDGFGKGSTGPIYLVARVDDAATQMGKFAEVTEAVQADRDVESVLGPQPNDPENPTAVRWFVTPRGGPQDQSTTQLVERLRSDVLPPSIEAVGTDIFVTGLVAANVDMSDYMAERMPIFFGAVLTLSFVLLMIVFRSLLVPLKAVIMNLLSIAAAYGVIIALFQWGWLSDITGVQPGPIETWVPMMLFAVVFGLSMDYEVFLLSRVREEWKRTGDSRTSVADGLAATAKVITAAAAIMVVVFGSFMLEFERTMKMMGIGLATAIFLDATIVRLVLVPGTMELLGDKNWWLPKWLDRILPNLDVEGHAPPPSEAPVIETEERDREPVPTAGE
ncbi:MAG TPA: MMPL family transporter [Acidimicrobiia bacterium]|nr:MMPL family transporter [Acidimicrobiia bacterium]